MPGILLFVLQPARYKDINGIHIGIIAFMAQNLIIEICFLGFVFRFTEMFEVVFSNGQ